MLGVSNVHSQWVAKPESEFTSASSELCPFCYTLLTLQLGCPQHPLQAKIPSPPSENS